MTDFEITSGVVKYGETRKIAEYENKRADIELAFNVADGQSYQLVIETVKTLARKHCTDMLTGSSDKTILTEPVKAKKPAPNMPVIETPQDLTATEVLDRVEQFKKKALVKDAASMDDIKPDEPPKAPKAAKVEVPASDEITDEKLMEATKKHQDEVRNPIGIRALLKDLGVTSPPGRLIDLPQEKRKEYLTRLVKIPPIKTGS